MALQLKNKVDKEKKDTSTSKTGKYKRKKNVFGKSTTRFGLIGTVAVLVVAFVALKTIATLSQNKRQKKIVDENTRVEEQIKQYQRELRQQEAEYKNVGELIATLPTSFDQQATSLDIDRIIILSGLKESTLTTRKITPEEEMPVECSVSTVKAIKITLTLYGANDDIDSVLKFFNLINQYSHENFYYIESLNFVEDRTIYKRTSTSITMYTFYNDITLSTETEASATTK